MAGKFRILSLDGGGIRGLITAIWLDAVAAELSRQGKPPLHQSFELIAGTSTGAILACAIASAIAPARIVDLYRNDGPTIFPGPRSTALRLIDELRGPLYSDAPLIAALQAQFQQNTFGSLTVPTIVTSYDVLNRSAVVFKSFRPEYRNLRIWEVCVSSASAPVYFPAHVLRMGNSDLPMIDGGVVANNPTACAIAEGAAINRAKTAGAVAMADFVVASFGTGQATQPISVEHARSWGAVHWAVPIIDVLFDGASESVDYIARSLITPGNYFRFQAYLQVAYDALDNATAANLNDLAATADSFLNSAAGRQMVSNLVAAL
jgi:patatin-like phospholipase/acyl hydrolase